MKTPIEAEHIKGAAYTAMTMHTSVLNGWTSFEEAKETVLKWMNFGLPEGEYYDMKNYFKKEISGSGDVMKNVTLRLKTEKEAWEALEFFGLL